MRLNPRALHVGRTWKQDNTFMTMYSDHAWKQLGKPRVKWLFAVNDTGSCNPVIAVMHRNKKMGHLVRWYSSALPTTKWLLSLTQWKTFVLTPFKLLLLLPYKFSTQFTTATIIFLTDVVIICRAKNLLLPPYQVCMNQLKDCVMMFCIINVLWEWKFLTFHLKYRNVAPIKFYTLITKTAYPCQTKHLRLERASSET